MTLDLAVQEQIKMKVQSFLAAKKLSGTHYKNALQELKDISHPLTLEGGRRTTTKKIDWKNDIEVTMLASTIRLYYELTPLELAIE